VFKYFKTYFTNNARPHAGESHIFNYMYGSLLSVASDVVKTSQIWIGLFIYSIIISERELMFMFAICRRPSVCLSVVCLSSVVCNVRAPYSGD